MAQLNNQYVSSSFQGLLKMTDSTQGLTNTLQTIQTGDGDNSPLQMSLTQVNISGSFLVNGQPVSIDTGSFATTGSNSFYGYQNIYVAPGQDTVSVLVQSGSMGEHQIGLTVQPNGSTGLSFANKGNNFFQTNGNLIINSTIGGDGTGSISINVSSGSFNVTSPKVKINDGNITTTGSLIVSGSNNKLIGDINSTSTVNTIIGRTIIQGGAGGGSGATPRLIISGSDGGATTIGRSFVSIDTTKTTGTPTAFGAGLNAYGAPETEGGINIGVYTPDIYTDDYELNIKVTTGGTQFQDFDNFNAFNYEDFLVIPPNVGDSPSPQFKRSVGITGSIDITGQYLVNGVPVSGDRNGLITTGSITDTQQITGSLILGNTILSGSLIGGVVNGGLIKIQTEANRSGSLQFNITGSNPISQSNFVFGSAGPASVFNTGSVIISGSNNIIFNGFRQNTLNQGTFGYIQGNNNIISSIPLITTSSFLNSNYFVSNNNYLNGVVLFDAVASGSITDLSFYFNQMTNNNIGSAQTFRHKSGSLSFTNNNIQGTINSFATQSFLYPSGGVSGPTMNGNVHAGSATVLSHISSSIIYSSNISNSGNLLIRNSATHPAALNGSGSVTLANNIFGGGQQTLTISGSGTQNSKGISQNIVVGLNNELNIIVSGSNAFISNTAILGTSLIVSGSNSSTNGGGSTFVGRYNATGSLQESTNETVFVVGTGTGTGNRRNALRIDSNNNSNFTGSVNISGSAVITGSLTLNGVAVTSSDRNGLITTGSATTYPNQYIQGGLQIVSGSLWAKGRNSLNNLAYGEFALASITSAGSNTGLGNNALSSATTGGGNLAVGGAALSNMTTGQDNIGIGNQALLNNISGSHNTAIGANTLQNNVAGFNLAIGTDALKNNTTGQYNNAIGDASLYFNTTGDSNLAIGKNTLFFNTTGGSNVGIGGGALATNVSGSNNLAVGNSALGNSVSSFNLAVGASALGANTTGENNVAIGQSAFQANTTGGKNTAIGWNSGVNNLAGSTNTIIGAQALQNNINGSGNVAIGNSAGYYSTGSNGFYIGNDNYGSLSNEQEKSMMYGEFNGTTANQNLRINANTKIIGDVMFSSGSNKTMGTVALDGGNPGSVTVSNSLVTANSLIFLTKQTLNHTNGYVAISSKGTGTFTITSNHNGDADTVAYQIINPA